MDTEIVNWCHFDLRDSCHTSHGGVGSILPWLNTELTLCKRVHVGWPGQLVCGLVMNNQIGMETCWDFHPHT